METESPLPQGSADLRIAKELLISSRCLVLTHILTVTFYVTLLKKYFIHLFVGSTGSWLWQRIFAVSRGIFVVAHNSLVVACEVSCSTAWGS